MLDFWFTLGSAVIDPTLLTRLNAVPPVFKAVKRTITENGTSVIHGNPASGVLDQTGTMKLRQKLRDELKAFAPNLPISIRAAGKMSQLLVVPEIKFVDQMTLATTAYNAACAAAGFTTAASNFTPLFPAFLGVCLIDANLTLSLSTGPGNDSDQTIEEFGINPNPTQPDLKVMSQLVQSSSAFVSAQTSLLRSPAWQGGCGDQMMFWSSAGNNANERAILP